MERITDFSLDEEVKCGQLVTTEVKRLWAMELDMSEQLRHICKKHGIKYFAGGDPVGSGSVQGLYPLG